MNIQKITKITGFGVANVDLYRREVQGASSERWVSADYDALEILSREREIDPGDKYSCSTPDEFRLFFEPFTRRSVGQTTYHVLDVSTGGSVTNTFRDIARSMCGITPRLVTYVGKGAYAEVILLDCKDDGVEVVPIPIPKGHVGPVDPPINLMVQPPQGGERKLIKGPCDVLVPAFKAYSEASDIGIMAGDEAYFAQGAAIMRFGIGYLDFVESKLLPETITVFSLPTVKKYPENFGDQNIQKIKDFVFQRTSILSANKDEFKALFGDDFNAGLEALQDGWRANPQIAGKDRRLALITDGANDLTLVIEGRAGEANRIVPIKARQNVIEGHKVGSGDATIAGLIAGLKAGMSPEDAAYLARDFGAIQAAQTEKISVIKDIISSLHDIGGHAAEIYLDLIGRGSAHPAQHRLVAAGL